MSEVFCLIPVVAIKFMRAAVLMEALEKFLQCAPSLVPWVYCRGINCLTCNYSSYTVFIHVI